MKRVFKDFTELSQAFAELIIKDSENRETYSVALSGGNTPGKIFRYLAENYYDSINWNKLRFYWGDDRCVPPDDNDSNYKLAKDNLFEALGINENQVFRVRGEDYPAEEAIRYSGIIKNTLSEENGLPVFDLIWLGLGEDGHTASIFPHQIELFNSNNICEVATHPESGQKRITLTGNVINNAKTILFIATGKNKAEKLKEVFVDKNMSLPASHVNPLNGKLFLFADKDASGLI